MIKKSIKKISMAAIAVLTLVNIYGCENVPATEPEHDSANIAENTINESEEIKVEETIQEETLPTFEEAIESIREKSIWKIENTINKELNKLKNNEVKNESEWSFTASYWDTNWTFKINFSWSTDNNFENILWSFKMNVWINNADKIDEDFPKKLNVWRSYTALLQKANQYFKLDNIDINSLKELIIKDEGDELEWEGINKIIGTLKGKWIDFNINKICNEETEDHSEIWCEISKNAQVYTEILSWGNKKEIENKLEEILKTVNDISDAIKTSIFSTKVLTLEKQVEYEGNQAYKFTINTAQLKKDIKSTLQTYAEYYAEKKAKEMEKFNEIYGDDYSMSEEDIKEMKQEISDSIDEMFDEISKNTNVKNFDAYLVYDETTKSFDLVIEKLDIVVKSENTVCDYNNVYSWEEYVWPKCEEEVKYLAYSIAFSSKKHLIVFVGTENNKVKSKVTIGYNLTWETFNIKISYAGNDDNDKFTEDLVVVNLSYWKNETGNTINNNIAFLVKIKKELFKIENDISVGFNASGKSIYWEKQVLPNIDNPIPFYKVEKLVEKIQKEYESPSDRDAKRKANLSTIWSAILSYSFMEWKYPETNTTNMVSVKKIEDKIKDHLWNELPSDPKENNSFYFDWTNFVWEYWYKLMTKNDNKKTWFLLMAKVETEWSANFVAWMKIADDLNNFRTCKEVIKWDKNSLLVNEDWVCTYKSVEDLRYVYTY